MATTANVVLIAAERTLIGGRAERGLGVQLGRLGQITAVAPVATLGRPTHVYPHEMLIPGLVDVCAPSLASLVTAVHQGEAPSNALTDALTQRLRQGVTTLGVPHSPVGRFAPKGWRNPFAEVDLLVAAAQAVGIRVAVLDTITVAGKEGRSSPQEPYAARTLDEAIGAFEQLVRQLMGYQDHRLSWALHAPLGANMPIDALMGLRVRLGHLPCLVELAREDSGVTDMAKHGLLDACVTLLDGIGVSPNRSRILRHFGAFHAVTGHALKRMLQHAKFTGEPTGLSPTAVMTGHAGDGSPFSADVLASTGTGNLSAQSWLSACTRGGTRALGLYGGSLSPSAWFDAFTVPLAHPALRAVERAECPIEDALPKALVASLGVVPARRTWVAGVEHTACGQG